VGHFSTFITIYAFVGIELDRQLPLNERQRRITKAWPLGENAGTVVFSVCSANIRDAAPEERDDLVSVEMRETDPRDRCIVRRGGLLIPNACLPAAYSTFFGLERWLPG
jgi:hypothetical protein